MLHKIIKISWLSRDRMQVRVWTLREVPSLGSGLAAERMVAPVINRCRPNLRNDVEAIPRLTRCVARKTTTTSLVPFRKCRVWRLRCVSTSFDDSGTILSPIIKRGKINENTLDTIATTLHTYAIWHILYNYA